MAIDWLGDLAQSMYEAAINLFVGVADWRLANRMGLLFVGNALAMALLVVGSAFAGFNPPRGAWWAGIVFIAICTSAAGASFWIGHRPED